MGDWYNKLENAFKEKKTDNIIIIKEPSPCYEFIPFPPKPTVKSGDDLLYLDFTKQLTKNGFASTKDCYRQVLIWCISEILTQTNVNVRNIGKVSPLQEWYFRKLRQCLLNGQIKIKTDSPPPTSSKSINYLFEFQEEVKKTRAMFATSIRYIQKFYQSQREMDARDDEFIKKYSPKRNEVNVDAGISKLGMPVNEFFGNIHHGVMSAEKKFISYQFNVLGPDYDSTASMQFNSSVIHNSTFR